MDKKEFDRLAKMYYLEEKMRMLYAEMLELADNQDVEDLVKIGSGLLKIYERCTEKLLVN